MASSRQTPKAANETPRQLRVLSWNAHYANTNTAALMEVIGRLHPDLIVIQEIGRIMAATVAFKLQADFPYQERYPTGGAEGMAVLSRYPFLSTMLPDFEPGTGCNCQPVTLDFQGQPISLINAHPWPPLIQNRLNRQFPYLWELDTAKQDPIFDQLLARIGTAASPLLVVGDLNTMPSQPNYQRLRAVLRDAFIEAGEGYGFTFPVGKQVGKVQLPPVVRIDYILVDDAWQVQKMWSGTIAGSDHRYVAADLVLQ